jgi:hypothetical protein
MSLYVFISIMAKYLQGLFKPIHPQKYRGDLTNIVFRSSWEMAYMCRLDKDPNIVEWSSEETVIPYVSPADGGIHRYFVDFQYKTKDNRIFLIEIKPVAQTKQPPVPKSKRVSKRYMRDIQIFAVNKAKWEAALNFCEERGWVFKVLTEKDLGFGTLNTKRIKRK